jgi:hypothetical protein
MKHLGLVQIDVYSGVNTEGMPFCHTKATSDDGTLMLGQSTPFEVRSMALGWLHAADAAEHDAAVFNLLRSEIGVDAEAAARFIGKLREFRADDDVSTIERPSS